MSVPLGSLLPDEEVLGCQLSRTFPVSGLCYDSRKAVEGDLFFALPGVRSHGVKFVSDAASRGAVGAVTEEEIPSSPVPLIRVRDARVAMGRMASAFYGHPSGSLKVVGVTGTNGKTTSVFLTRHILEETGRRCGMIGTIRYITGDGEEDAPRTTPESIDLQSLLARMRDAGCSAAAMEVSSHALSQKRTVGTEFDAAVFTNLTQDHLDYHKTMSAYFEAKALLFDGIAAQTAKKPRAVINADDRFGHRLIERIGRRVATTTFGFGTSADFRATDIHMEPTGTTFHLEARRRTYLVRLPLIGAFNVSNAVAALTAAAVLGTEVRAAVAALARAPQVPGRLERVPARRNFQVFVDYAHTDDALRSVLRTLRTLRPNRLIVVIGCGGDRDRSKRPLMAAAAEQEADHAIFTSDNPRSEDPGAILADMRTGLRGSNHEEISDRDAAIRRAVEIAESGDIVLIAGKGHETYQEFATGRVPFSDVKAARWAIESRPVDLELPEEEGV
jgi:UDP-N-acetylmuramoyl-L-alanyl-D-glutamate--2,6-diaminopimelate ligase